MFKFLDGKTVILASTSPRRKALLEQIGLSVNVFRAEIDEEEEVLSENLTEPSEIAKFLAVAKAKHAFEKYCGLNNGVPDLLIASDTVVDLDGSPIGKPKNKQGAIEALTRLSGNMHEVHTGVCFMFRKSEDVDVKTLSFVESCKVHFGQLSSEVINTYVATGECYGKAGSYGIQGIGSILVEKIEGDYNAVVGFPLRRFFVEVRKAFCD